MAELPALCEALGLNLQQNGTQWIVSVPGQKPSPLEHSQAGLYFGNREIPDADIGATPPMVDLQAFVKVIGGRCLSNPTTQSIHVFPAPARAVTSDDFRVVVFNHGNKPPSQLSTLPSKLAKVVPLSSVYIDTSDSASPAYQRYSSYLEIGALPYTVLLTPSGRAISAWRGMPRPEQVSVKAKAYLAQRKVINSEPVIPVQVEVGT